MITVQELYENARGDKYKNNHAMFLTDAEKAFEFENMPDNVRNKIHQHAWEHGHSSGYYEVVTCYFDFVDLAKACYENV